MLLCVPYAPAPVDPDVEPDPPVPLVLPVAVLLSVELLAPVLPLPAMPLVPPVPLLSPVTRGPDEAPLDDGLPGAVAAELVEPVVLDVVSSLRPQAVTDKASATLKAINEGLIMWTFL